MKSRTFTIPLVVIATLLLLASFFIQGRFFKRRVAAPKKPVAVCGKTDKL